MHLKELQVFKCLNNLVWCGQRGSGLGFMLWCGTEYGMSALAGIMLPLTSNISLLFKQCLSTERQSLSSDCLLVNAIGSWEERPSYAASPSVGILHPLISVFSSLSDV